MTELTDELKMLYIEEELSQHGEWLCDILTKEIERRKMIQEGNLHASLNYHTFKEGNNPGVAFEFLQYGRFIDISAYKKKNRHAVNTNKIIWGIKDNINRIKKNKRWYARNMYGGLNRLISRIMYGLSDQEIERLKGILENRKNQLS